MAKTIGDSRLTDVWADSGTVVEPPESKINVGWQLGEQPPHEYMNWIQNTFGEKINHVLQNGVPEWNSETTYRVGDITKSSGALYVALSENTNSEPPNLDWEEVSGVDPDDFLQVANNLSDLGDVNAARANLGLGSAAVATVVDGQIDTTAGRLLNVGYRGLGGVSPLTANFDTELNGGTFYAISPTGQPESLGGAVWTLLVIPGDNTSQTTQIATYISTNTTYIRSRSGGVWGAWRKIATGFSCVARVNFNGLTTPPTIRASGNISSVDKNSAGNYTVNFLTARPNANYTVVGTCNWRAALFAETVHCDTQTVNGFRCITTTGSAESNASAADHEVINLAVFE